MYIQCIYSVYTAYIQCTYSVHTAYIQRTYSVHTCTVFFDRTELPVQITIVVLMILEQVPDSGVTTKVSFRGRGGGGLGVSSMPTTVLTCTKVCVNI